MSFQFFSNFGAEFENKSDFKFKPDFTSSHYTIYNNLVTIICNFDYKLKV